MGLRGAAPPDLTPLWELLEEITKRKLEAASDINEMFDGIVQVLGLRKEEYDGTSKLTVELDFNENSIKYILGKVKHV